MLNPRGESGGWCSPAPWPPRDQPFGVCGDYTLWKKMRCYSLYTADWINDYARGWHP